MNTELKEVKETPKKSAYKVMSIEKAETPEGLPGDNWYSYTIGRGQSKIEGLKPGSLDDVTEYAESVVEGLNNRFIKASSAYSSSKKK